MYLKIVKKLIGILGYKLIDKNIIKNERQISNGTYLTLNKILTNLFESNQIKSIIQIGANDGMRFDLLNKFIKNYSPATIFVEPIKSNFNILKNNYISQSNVFFENSAISINNEINHLFKVKDAKVYNYDEHVIGITSFKKNHLIKHGIKNSDITMEKVQSISIDNLLKKYNFRKFDLFFIDAEGYDGIIVSDFIKNHNIRPYIVFEYIHLETQILKNTLELIKKNNFLFFKIEENIFCFPEERKSFVKIIN
tara:strand:+ start:2737 stop:3492 length:756 start_codon:yes stop_codon:yes gene_type:complete